MADSFSYDARGVAENESRRVALAAESKDGVFHGSGAKTSILLRENVTASDTVTSGALKADGSIYALRLEALYSGGTAFSYSTDGTSWTSLTPGAYTYLDNPVSAVYAARLACGRRHLRGKHGDRPDHAGPRECHGGGLGRGLLRQ